MAEDLAAFVVTKPPTQRGGWHVWEHRFAEIAEQGLIGQWINVTGAWGVRPTNRANAVNAGVRNGLTVEARVADSNLYLRVVGPVSET